MCTRPVSLLSWTPWASLGLRAFPRSAMNSIAQLRVDLTSSGDQPSAILALYFKNCKVDPTKEVLQRVERLGQLFSQMFGHAVEPRCVGLGKWRFILGVRLYYRVMVSMLKSLTAFDFYKVIESFIKAEPSRSKDIVKHLELCEHLIMETIAWRRDSAV